MGASGKYIIAYNGSMRPWQEPGDVLTAFRACLQMRENAHLLVLTSDPEVAEAFLRTSGLEKDRWTVMRVSHEQVQRKLMAADAGLLLRRVSPVNAVACPIKLAEYAASGVPVVASKGIGDLDWLIPRYRLGEIVTAPEEASRATLRLTFDHAGAQAAIDEVLSWPVAAETLVGLYSRVFRRYE